MTKRPPGVRPGDRATDTGRSLRGEGRYRRGARRTTAEPLTASWRLDEAEPDPTVVHRPVPPPRSSGRRRALAAMHANLGWRVYALPVLMVVTILVVVNTAKRATTAEPAGASSPPVATEGGAVPVDTASGTAALPSGAVLPEAGAGTWHVVPGNGPVVGKGPHLYRYQVAVEDGIDPAVYGGDDAFAQDVDATLADPRSWIAAGTIALQRVDAGYPHPDFVISLTTPNTDHRPDLCDYQIHYETSCWRAGVRRVVINLARWVRGALAFAGDLGLYRQYAINHEVGHVFGNQHVGCATNGGLAPVMMQQTFGVADDYVYDVNQVDPSNRNRVPRDGKVCKPNAWPYPDGSGVPAQTPTG